MTPVPRADTGLDDERQLLIAIELALSLMDVDGPASARRFLLGALDGPDHIDARRGIAAMRDTPTPDGESWGGTLWDDGTELDCNGEPFPWLAGPGKWATVEGNIVRGEQ